MGQPSGEQRGDVERADQVVRDELAALRDGSVQEQLASIRREFTQGLTTAGVQIGAVEKTLLEKINGVKVWGVAGLVGGQTVAAFLTKYGPPEPVAQAFTAVIRSFS